MAVQTIRLYLDPGTIADVAHACQLDTKRPFKFLVFDENGEYTIPSGSTLSINGQKPDGYLFNYTESDRVGNLPVISKSGNQITVYTTQQMTAAVGNTECQIRISKDGQDIGILPFTMYVQKTPLANEEGYSKSELPSIVAKYNEMTEESEAWAKGTRNGTSVPSTDQTYHNNSKYYSQLAATSAATATSKAAEATTQATKAKTEADRAESYTAHPPYIGANGNWYVWSITQSKYIDSGVDASITVNIADVTLLEPGAQPYVTNTGTNTDPIFHLFLPRSTTTYEDAKAGGYAGSEEEFYSDLRNFKTLSEDAVTAASNASDSEATALTAKNRAVLAETNSATSEANALSSALESEAWAVGKRDGVDVPSSDETYRNNSKYYAGVSKDVKNYVSTAWQEMTSYYQLILSMFGADFGLITEVGDTLTTEDGNRMVVDY